MTVGKAAVMPSHRPNRLLPAADTQTRPQRTEYTEVMNPTRVVTLALCALAPVAHAQSGSQIFTAVTKSSAVLLQWTEAAGQLKGSAQLVSVSATPTASGTGLTVTNSGVSGTHSGKDYSLVFDKSILAPGVASAPAVLDNNHLVINIPSESGGLSELILTRSTLSGFNMAVTTLKANASKIVDALRSDAALKQAAAKRKQDAESQARDAENLKVRIVEQTMTIGRLVDIIETSVTDLDHLSQTDTRRLEALVSFMKAQQIPTLRNSGQCPNVPGILSEVDALTTALGTTLTQLPDAISSTQDAVTAYNGERQNLASSSQAAAQAITANTSALIKKADASMTAGSTKQDAIGALLHSAVKGALTLKGVAAAACPTTR